MPNLYIIAGPNGAGKTTTALRLLPGFLDCIEYVNADAIAAGLSPFNVESVAIQAGRLMIERIHALADSGVDFAFETTLASRSFAPMIRECARNGYLVTLLFLWLHSPELAVERVALRVASGGHAIPEGTIRRRYDAGRKNLTSLYIPIVDMWTVFDNSGDEPVIVAEGDRTEQLIYKREQWNLLTADLQPIGNDRIRKS